MSPHDRYRCPYVNSGATVDLGSVASVAQSGRAAGTVPIASRARRYAGHGHGQPHSRHRLRPSNAQPRERRCRSTLLRNALRIVGSTVRLPSAAYLADSLAAILSRRKVACVRDRVRRVR